MKGKRSSILLVLVAAVALLAAACGSSGGSQAPGGSSTGSAKLTGAPIKIMSIVSLHAQGTSVYPEDLSAAKAAALAVNKAGGIHGHPIQIIACDDQVNPNDAATCGQNAVNDKVVAVDSGSFYTASYIDALQNASIPLISPELTEPDFTSPVSFNIDAASLSAYTACVKELANQGAHKIAFASIDVAVVSGIMPYLLKAVQNAGQQSAGNTMIPVTAVDYAQYAQTLKSEGATGVVLLGGIAEVGGVLRAAAQIGYQPKWCTEDAFTYAEVKQLAPADNGLLYMTSMPIPISSKLPVISTYNTQMNAEENTGDSNASIRSTGTFSIWLEIWALADVLKNAPDPTSSASLLATLRKTQSVNLFNFITWHPNQPGKAPLIRIPSGTIYVNSVVNGVPTPENVPPINAYTLFG
jgi:branched-chain amino acid transport system substrate-binding protein